MSVSNRTAGQAIMNKLSLENQLKKGGEWLRSARTWMQHNIRGGDSLNWSSTRMVQVRFCDLEEFAIKVAISAVNEDRQKIQ